MIYLLNKVMLFSVVYESQIAFFSRGKCELFLPNSNCIKKGGSILRWKIYFLKKRYVFRAIFVMKVEKQRSNVYLSQDDRSTVKQIMKTSYSIQLWLE